jgi:hypothetical protein
MTMLSTSLMSLISVQINGNREYIADVHDMID